MPPRADSKRARVQRWLADNAAALIDGPAFDRIRAAVAPVSESYLRHILRDSGVPLSPQAEGVVSSDLAELKRTLLALSAVYAGGDRTVRRIVIEAKNRLKWAEARARDETGKAMRAEMVLWTMTWLENPEAFDLWVGLREKRT
jgi:hypothetical protein